MIKIINSSNLKTDADLICSFCGKDHKPFGTEYEMYKEGEDFVFETEHGEEWCICMDCKIKLDIKYSEEI